MASRPGKRPRAMASAAGTAISAESVAETRPSCRLTQKLSRNCGFSAMARYQRSDAPSKGIAMKPLSVKETTNRGSFPVTACSRSAAISAKTSLHWANSAVVALLTETSLTNAEFDPGLARVRCKKEQKERVDLVLADCFKDEIVSARNFTLFQAIYSDAGLQSSFQICLKRWTDDNLIDWGMVSYCAQDQLDGFDRLAPLQSKSRN